DVLRRYMSNSAIKQAFRNAASAGLHSSAFVMLGLPYETEEDLFATVRLLAEIKPGRFRWSLFYPFVGTDAYKMALEGGFINREKLEKLQNFFTESPLQFGAEQDLLIDKMNAAFPWFVNAASDLECSAQYRRLVNEILSLSEDEWKEYKLRVKEMDSEISRENLRKGYRHYAVKFNRFMGVDSDYFLKEEEDVVQ
ncbi:MAG: hypothetical protein N2234_10525, partial [Planctomycetota bacterium]|nr:hypothetical protein [Planctomycetota bacterium]